MTDQQTPSPRHPGRVTAVIVSVLVVVIAAVAGIGLLTSGAAAPASTTAAPAAAASETIPAETTATPLATATTAAPTDTPTPVRSSAAPTPQPTKTATISKPTQVPIKKELTATVVKMEAVTGTADGPGEIGGPSVRFTITITNTTGKVFVLSNTVVNAFYGSDATPAVQLRSPGGKDFPASVANGASATGVFVFNIPAASRSNVKVTVDTAVQNPVIAFQGAAPRA
jgi:hypothetical protein